MEEDETKSNYSANYYGSGIKGKGNEINLELKDMAICSDGNTYKNRKKTQILEKLGKRKRRLQLFISGKYEKNKKGRGYCKTGNNIKREKTYNFL